MKRTKWTALLLVGLLAAGVYGAAPVSAYGNVWMNVHSDIQAKQFKKIVLFPLPPAEAGTNLFQRYNNDIYKQAKKRVKKTNFLGYGDEIEEKKDILRGEPQYEDLLQDYASEEDRRKAVYDVTAADGYLIPHITRRDTFQHLSPEKWVTVKKESYYNISNGPDGDKYNLNHQEWEENHLIPSKMRTLYLFDMEFTLYDAYNGDASMTYADRYRGYGGEGAAVDTITERFAKDWNLMRKDKRKKPKKDAPTLGFGNISLPDSAADDSYAIKTIWYAVKDEAGNTLKQAKVDYDNGEDRYKVSGSVTAYDEFRTWYDPSALVGSASLVNTEYFTWTDSKGKKHTGSRNYYKTLDSDISDYPGGYSYGYRVAMDLAVTDTKTGDIIYTYSGDETNDSYGDALRSILHDFYKKVDDKLEDIAKGKTD